MLIADPTVGLLSVASTSGTSRLDWIITLAIVCAMFAICATIVVRGKRTDLKTPRTRRQNLRIKRARHGLWVLAALICLTIARIIVAPH
jgi:hypothetical protein